VLRHFGIYRDEGSASAAARSAVIRKPEQFFEIVASHPILVMQYTSSIDDADHLSIATARARV
jgi:hypothetical protein